MGTVVLTHPGKLGDMLYALPVASWLYKERGLKTHWVLPMMFGPFQHIERLLQTQVFTEAVSLVKYTVRNYDCGGQPYKFNPNEYGVETDCWYNLGFRHYPSKFIPAFYAEEYGLGYDRNFVMLLRHDFHKTFRMDPDVRSCERAMERIIPHADPLPSAIDLLDLTKILHNAREVHLWFCGLAVLSWFCNLKATVYRVPGHGSLELYFPEPRRLKFVEVTL
jgi:hypothetical protein